MKIYACMKKDFQAVGLYKFFNIDGFSFDCAVHLSFTKSDSLRSIFDKQEY